MGAIQTEVEAKNYESALQNTAIRLAGLMDDLDDEKNAAPISRELRLVLLALGIGKSDADSFLAGLRASVDAKV